MPEIVYAPLNLSKMLTFINTCCKHEKAKIEVKKNLRLIDIETAKSPEK